MSVSFRLYVFMSLCPHVGARAGADVYVRVRSMFSVQCAMSHVQVDVHVHANLIGNDICQLVFATNSRIHALAPLRSWTCVCQNAHLVHLRIPTDAASMGNNLEFGDVHRLLHFPISHHAASPALGLSCHPEITHALAATLYCGLQSDRDLHVPTLSVGLLIR